MSEVQLLKGFENTVHFKERITDNIEKIGARSLWSDGFIGEGVVIAVLDTGCSTEHPDLRDQIIGGYNFTSDYAGNPEVFEDLNGHGTHVAGVIAAAHNNNSLIGTAPGVKLLIVKVLNKDGYGSVKGLIEGINYAIDWRGPNNETVNIMSLSLGLSSPIEELHQVIKEAVSLNIAVVVAAGNGGDGKINTLEYSYPAAYEEVITVGAVNHNQEVADFSNTNSLVDLYAPGVLIESTYLENGFMRLNGTSMAQPHVSGALALLINKYESIYQRKPSESSLYQYLMEHTDKVYLADYDQTIFLLNLAKTVESDVKFDKTLLLECFCEARKSQAYFTKCLEKAQNKKERDFILSLIVEAAQTANYIKDYCDIVVEKNHN